MTELPELCHQKIQLHGQTPATNRLHEPAHDLNLPIILNDCILQVKTTGRIFYTLTINLL